MADDVATILSPVAVATTLSDMSREERLHWRTADVPGRPSAADRNLDIPFPFGWFPTLLSDELAVGQVRPLRYFGSDLVVWRGEDGTVQMPVSCLAL